MTVFLETTIDKFTFRVDPGCLFYCPDRFSFFLQ